MRAVVQRVRRAQVSVDRDIVAKIQNGLLVFLGVGKSDTRADAEYLAGKVARLRVFEDVEEKMNLAIAEVSGQLLVVSQFTLYGNVRRGTRPSFDDAAPAGQARELYEYFITRLRESGIKVEAGRFRARMQVELVNDGPVTILIDSKQGL